MVRARSLMSKARHTTKREYKAYKNAYKQYARSLKREHPAWFQDNLWFK